MKNNNKYFVLIAIIFVYSCSNLEITSKWKKSNIEIDGNRKDWENNIQYFENEKVGIGVQNDNEFIYLCLVTIDNSKIMKVLHNGLTIWLDPLDSDGKTVGIQYPVKKFEQNSDKQFKNKRMNENLENSPEKESERILIDQNELLIVNEDNFPLNAFPLKTENGLEIKIGFDLNQLIYELRIPIGGDNKKGFFTDVLPAESIKIGFESAKMNKQGMGMDKPNMDMENSSGMGGMIGGGRGMGKGGGRPDQDNSQMNTDPIEFELKVNLSNGK